MNTTDATHNPALESWVAAANLADNDFPVQNLPFGRFRTAAGEPWRIGVAIGDQVLDLAAAGLLDAAQAGDMNRLMAQPPAQRRALRAALSQGLARGSAQQAAWAGALRPQAAVALGVPCHIGDYTDFYVGIHHATTIGRFFRPDNPLLPNYKWVPIGYHGRASTVQASGLPFHRPNSQTKGANEAVPRLRPTQRLDFELELALWVGPPNAMGQPVPMGQAEEHLFGLGLFNDWSARDVQAWEYQPLGPFLSKNFASTVSPWVVTMEALAPFRLPFARPAGDPEPLPYLCSAANSAAGAIDIELQVLLHTQAMRHAGLPAHCISRSNYAQAAYWTAAQLLAHHTVGGCAMNAGDLLGSGTLSGPSAGQAGSLLELSHNGQQPVHLPGGEQRRFLEDGDSITLQGHCQRAGWRRIGLGQCTGTVLPALDAYNTANQPPST